MYHVYINMSILFLTICAQLHAIIVLSFTTLNSMFKVESYYIQQIR